VRRELRVRGDDDPFPALAITRAALARDKERGAPPADGEALHVLANPAAFGCAVLRRAASASVR
jgi:hypothetical protein